MGKPFKFKLDKVLDYREQLEEQAKAALSKAKAKHAAQAALVEELQATLDMHMKKLAESQQSANDMWLWQQYKEALEQDVYAAWTELKNLDLKLQRCMTEAVERSKEKKLLEKLKETQLKKHRNEENAREEKENDEMATIRYESQDI